jgi:hypothetical protein
MIRPMTEALMALLGTALLPGIQLSMPDGYRMPPHFHPTDEHVEVKQGTLLIGMGDRLDIKKTIAAALGDTGTAPAGVHQALALFRSARGPR